jgi:hypothetical protein
MRALTAAVALPWLLLGATRGSAAETFESGRSAAGHVITAAFIATELMD